MLRLAATECMEMASREVLKRSAWRSPPVRVVASPGPNAVNVEKVGHPPTTTEARPGSVLPALSCVTWSCTTSPSNGGALLNITASNISSGQIAVCYHRPLCRCKIRLADLKPWTEAARRELPAACLPFSTELLCDTSSTSSPVPGFPPPPVRSSACTTSCSRPSHRA